MASSMISGVKKCNVLKTGANSFRKNEMRSDIERRAKAIASSASAKTPDNTCTNPNYVVRLRNSSQRVYGYVIAANPVSVNHNSKHNTLLKSMDAGR